MKDSNKKNILIKTPSMANLELFLQLFQGRETVFGKQWLGGLGYSPVRPERSINTDDVLSHIQGTETYGIYPVKKDNTVKFVCFDIDLPKNFAEVEEDTLVTDKSILFPQVKNICTTIMDVLRTCSFNSKDILIEDTGGRGYHIWIFFEFSIPAISARKFAYSILEKANVQCEVFPKQNEVAEGRYGNLIKLPLGLHKKYKQYSSFIDIAGKNISRIENPFVFLTEIVPTPVSVIFDTTKEIAKKKGLKHARPREAIIPAEAIPKETVGEVEKSCRIGDLVEKCKAFSNLKKKAVNQNHLEHEERLALAYVMINVEDGEEILHQILSNCSDYDREHTQKEIDYLKTRKMKPISCRRLIEQGICDKYCRSEIREQSMDLNRPEPSPIRFALWGDITEPESLWEIDVLNFENVYRKSNLYRAWEQVKDYARVNEAFFDIHAFEYFEEHLEENIETLRFELRNNSYLPAPYRWYLVPKERKGNDFEYRRMAFVHPRDYIVIQAIINVIGPIFEKSFSDSCLGYRLDATGRTGNFIFYGWQSSWQNRKRRVTSFLYHPKSFYYIKADISRFYDNIDRVRLYELILDKISSVPEISQIIKSFLENNYIEDLDGKEKICKPPSKGIPQGPAFSAFFANIYLKELDQLIEKKSYDYVRYVDDMAILCESKKQLEDIKELLGHYLSSVNLELNAKKTTAPCPVTNSEHLLDFLGEMKYGIAGLFVRESYTEQLMPPQFLKAKLDELLEIKKLDTYNLEEITKHLSYYLRMREKIGLELDDLAIGLSRKVLKKYALKPHHLVVILEVLIRNRVDLGTVISECQYPYLKIVLCIVLNNLEKTPPWAESLLGDLIEDESSYILRGTAYSV
ncbi:MAG: CRISPR-associated primase-polymerase type A1, partial [Candidatus Heimdallarchaeaceae archaeon]